MKGQLAAIFDLDGVIVDSSPYHFKAWQEFGKSIGASIDESFFKMTFGMTNAAILKQLLGRELSPEEIKDFADRKEERYRALIRGNIEGLPGAVELIRSLYEAGWPIALGSSAPAENVELILEDLGIRKYFSALSREGDYERGKPAPDVFLVAAKKLEVPPDRCVVFEDAVVGVEAARAAGMKCVAVTTTNAREKLLDAHTVCESLAEITVQHLCALWF